jgi:DNA-binding MarR family transcriptional regulator
LHIEASMSTLSKQERAVWRNFIESAWALLDILDTELQAESKLTLRWYDVLVHLEDAEHGLRMNELAERILSSQSGLTRVVDRMDEAGLVRRERPPDDRRVVQVLITPKGIRTLQAAREVHHRGIQEHFAAHLDTQDLAAMMGGLEKAREHVRSLRPGRISA